MMMMKFLYMPEGPPVEGRYSRIKIKTLTSGPSCTYHTSKENSQQVLGAKFHSQCGKLELLSFHIAPHNYRFWPAPRNIIISLKKQQANGVIVWDARHSLFSEKYHEPFNRDNYV